MGPGRGPFFHIQQAGIPHRLAAENIAYGQRTPEEVVKTWMTSAGHRANILNPGLSHLGIGAVRASNGLVYWTQLFTGR